MIRKLRARNYKSLHKVDLDLGPLNVFIGPNGAGKSNLIDLLRLFAEATRGDLETAVARRGGMEEVLWRGGAENFSIGIGYDLQGPLARTTKPETEPSIGYMLSIEATPEGLPGNKTEALFRRSGSEEIHLVSGKWGEGHAYNEIAKRELPYATEPNLLAIKALGYLSDMPSIRELRTFVEGWAFFNIDPAQARAKQQDHRTTNLDSDGSNLAPVLRTLEQDSPETYQHITEALRAVIPQFERLETEVGPDGRVSLGLRETPFAARLPAQNLSDGTIRLLSYLAIMSQEHPPSLICLEGPEQNLHPEALKHLRDLLHAVSQRTQVLVTTHSPRFVSHLEPEDVFTVDKEDGKSIFRRVADHENLDKWRQDFRLGDMWVYQFIGGWPNGATK